MAKNDRDCIFCDHCHAVWDYENGPYLMFCDEGREEIDREGLAEYHTCELFIETLNEE